jgi:hypothetical protein
VKLPIGKITRYRDLIEREHLCCELNGKENSVSVVKFYTRALLGYRLGCHDRDCK